MTDQWIPNAGSVGEQAPDGIPPPNTWTPGGSCAPPGGPSITGGVIITGVPAIVGSMVNGQYVWTITLNDGAQPANFSIDRYAGAALVDHPILISGADGSITFADPVYLSEDPTSPMQAATKEYVDANVVPGVLSWNGRQGAVTMTSQDVMVALGYAPYDNANPAGYQNAAQVQAAINFAVPQPSNNLPGMDGVAAPGMANQWARWDHIHPSDTSKYDASNPANYQTAAQVTASLSGYLPLSGGSVGPNSLIVNGPFSSINYAQFAGQFVSNGSATFNTGQVFFNSPATFSASAQIATNPGPTDSSQQIPTTSWVQGLIAGHGYISDAPSDGNYYTRRNAAWAVSPGGMTDAPNDGTAYARKSAAWAHLTHTDITDWTATLAPYALTTAVPAASTTLPLASGVAAIGTSTAYARADHVHPTTSIGDNRIINGDMRVDQRNNGAGGTAAGYTVDRWNYGGNVAGRGSWQRTATGATSTAAQAGFPYCLNFTNATAYSPAAADTFYWHQPIEADAISDLAWGSAGAQPATLSFWVSSSLTGTFSGALSNGGRSYPFTYSIPAAATWTKIAVTIPGDIAGTWTMNGNGVGVYLRFDLGSGANFRGPANAWASANYTGATGTVSVVGTNAATFNLTGVKLEIGAVATPFNRQSLAKSLADCQRYYQTGQVAVAGYGAATTAVSASQSLPVQMRAGATFAITTNGSNNVGTPALANANPGGFGVIVSGTVAATGGYTLNVVYTAAAEL